MLIYYATTLQKAGDFTDTFPSALQGIETLVNSSYETSGLPAACSRVFDVTNFLPRWLTDEDLNGDTLMVKFLQYYYDWYYCPQSSGIYAQDLFDYIDPDNYDSNVYLTALESYFPGMKNILTEYNKVLKIEKVKELIKSVKTEIFQRKGTSAAVNLFFGLLFDEVAGVQLKSSPAENISIEFELYVTSTISANDNRFYKALYEKFFHPYGLTYTLSIKELSNLFQDDQNEASAMASYNSGTDGVTLSAYEAVKIGNYIVYNMGDTGSLDYNTGCSSASPPPRGITANTADMPTYTHPNWYLGISGATAFGDINISEFLFLPYENNPNTSITSC